MEKKTLGEFFDWISETKNTDGRILLEEWRSQVEPEIWQKCGEKVLNEEMVLDVRKNISRLFAIHIGSVSSQILYDHILKAHAGFIQEYDEKAASLGFIITEPREPITPTELLNDIGIVRVIGGKVVPNPQAMS